MKNRSWFPVVYMFLATACVSAVLIGFSRLTQARVMANEQLMFERAVLEAFPDIAVPPSPQVHALFNRLFEKSADAAGAYVYRKDGRIAGYAVPVAGQGFWAPIRGVVGVNADRAAITGLAFYDQSETPGLGARITEKDFRGQFAGLTIGPPDRPIGIRPAAATPAEHEVHGITGATQTCRRLEHLINSGLAAWLQAMRSGGGAP